VELYPSLPGNIVVGWAFCTLFWRTEKNAKRKENLGILLSLLPSLINYWENFSFQFFTGLPNNRAQLRYLRFKFCDKVVALFFFFFSTKEMTSKKQLGKVLMYKLTRNKYKFSALLRENGSPWGPHWLSSSCQ